MAYDVTKWAATPSEARSPRRRVFVEIDAGAKKFE
jgi:hypothetical protein